MNGDLGEFSREMLFGDISKLSFRICLGGFCTPLSWLFWLQRGVFVVVLRLEITDARLTAVSDTFVTEEIRESDFFKHANQTTESPNRLFRNPSTLVGKKIKKKGERYKKEVGAHYTT